MRRRLNLMWVLGMALTLASCGGSEPTGPAGPAAPTASNNDASLNKDDYPVFPNADADADPAVSAEEGGKGFTG